MRIKGSVYLGLNDENDVPDDRKVRISEVDFSRSDISGELKIRNAQISGDLSLFSGRVGRYFELRHSSLRSAGLEDGEFGEIEVVNTKFADFLSAADAVVDHSVRLHRSVFTKRLDLFGARLQSDLDLQGSTLNHVDLTATQINGELVLGINEASELKYSVNQTWQGQSILSLEHAKIGLIRARLSGSVWPENLELNGLVYKGFAPPISDKTYVPRSDEMKAWLRKSAYSPAAYKQLVSILSDAGDSDSATAVAIDGRDREKQQAWHDRRYETWLWLFVLDWFIGYGYSTWYSIIWIGILTGLGALVFRSTRAAKDAGMPFGVSYSFDMLLPIIRLREEHYTKIDIQEWQRYYFYFHKVMGFILGSVIIASLAGLTK